jgi:hypothetical protein
MKRINEKQISIPVWLATVPAETQVYAEAIEKSCRKDLGKHQRAGIVRAPLVMSLVYFAKRYKQWMLGKTNRKRRYHRTTAKKLSKRLEKLSGDIRAVVESPPYLKPTPESPTGRALLGMEFLAESMRKDSHAFGRNGRSKPDVATYVLGWILRDNEDFNCWESLSHLVVESFLAVGISEKDTKHITADMIRKAAKRYRVRKPLWTEKEN